MPHRLRPSLAALAAACLAGLAAAQPEIESLLASLDSPSFEQREAAEARLLADDGPSLAQIESLLAGGDLSAEQRLRLESVGRDLFARMPRAGLGVRFANQRAERGVRLDGVVDGFPAAGFLRPGDIVLAVDGTPVSNSGHMGEVILSHTPGETIRLDIARPVGPPFNEMADPPLEQLTVEVPLGRYDDLQTGIVLTPSRLDGALKQRLSRAGVTHEPGTVGASLSPLAWLHAEGYDTEDASAPFSVFQPVPAWRVVSFGGQPASWVSSLEMRRGDQGTMIRRGNIALQADGIYDEIEEALAGYRALARRLAELRDEITRLAEATPENPAQAVARLERLRSERDEIERGLVEIVGVLEPVSPIPGSRP